MILLIIVGTFAFVGVASWLTSGMADYLPPKPDEPHADYLARCSAKGKKESKGGFIFMLFAFGMAGLAFFAGDLKDRGDQSIPDNPDGTKGRWFQTTTDDRGNEWNWQWDPEDEQWNVIR